MKRYNHGITCVVRIIQVTIKDDHISVYKNTNLYSIIIFYSFFYNKATYLQLVKLYEVLAAPLAAGVVIMVTAAGCPGFIKEMVREIGQSEPEEADARNISTFLEALAAARPDLILPVLDEITEHLSSEVSNRFPSFMARSYQFSNYSMFYVLQSLIFAKFHSVTQ